MGQVRVVDWEKEFYRLLALLDTIEGVDQAAGKNDWAFRRSVSRLVRTRSLELAHVPRDPAMGSTTRL